MAWSAEASRFINLQKMPVLLLSHLVIQVLSGCVSSKCADREPARQPLFSRRIELILWKPVTVEANVKCADVCKSQADTYSACIVMSPSVLANHCNLGYLELYPPVLQEEMVLDLSSEFQEYWTAKRKGKQPIDQSRGESTAEGVQQCESLVTAVLSTLVPFGLATLQSHVLGSTPKDTPVASVAGGLIAAATVAAFQKRCTEGKSRPKKQKVCKCKLGISFDKLLVPRPYNVDPAIDSGCEPESFAKKLEGLDWTIVYKDGTAAFAGEVVVFNPTRKHPTVKQYTLPLNFPRLIRGDGPFALFRVGAWNIEEPRPLDPTKFKLQGSFETGTSIVTETGTEYQWSRYTTTNEPAPRF